MVFDRSLETGTDEMDFAALLEASFAEKQPERGDIVTGTILAVDHHGLIVDVGLKRDGVVLRKDIEHAGTNVQYNVGDDIDVMILRMEDEDGNLLLSVSQASQLEDWRHAETLMASEEIWEGIVANANSGGLIIPFGNLRGFVPASHIADLPRGLSEDERRMRMNGFIGRKLNLKVIEVNRKRRRLVFSQREARRERREARKELLLDELREGEVRTGVVSGLRDFGAFVDLGGADGLIHISELAWHRVKHPREILNVGDEVEVYILRLDSEGKRIGLSLKRLQENPWAHVEQLYHIGQLVEGVVSRVAHFGAFVSLEPGIEALLHISQMADTAPEDPTTFVHEGQRLLMRVINIEPDKQRLGLSLKEVTGEESDRWKDRSDGEETSEADVVSVDADQADDSNLSEVSVQLDQQQEAEVGDEVRAVE
jgi:small subunit ribosomal protein S1